MFNLGLRKKAKLINDEAGSGGDRIMPTKSTREYLISFGRIHNLIASWIKSFKTYYERLADTFCEEILEPFQKIPITLQNVLIT